MTTAQSLSAFDRLCDFSCFMSFTLSEALNTDFGFRVLRNIFRYSWKLAQSSAAKNLTNYINSLYSLCIS